MVSVAFAAPACVTAPKGPHVSQRQSLAQIEPAERDQLFAWALNTLQRGSTRTRRRACTTPRGREGTFQEMNTAYALGLKREDAKLSVLKEKAKKDQSLKNTLDVYLLERDAPGGWLSLLYTLRNVGAHQRYAGRVIQASVGGVRSDPIHSFADPRKNPPTPVPGETTDVLAQFERDGRALVDRIRQTYP
jgi:hypothetical protein